jgi:hypothetical protein
MACRPTSDYRTVMIERFHNSWEGHLSDDQQLGQSQALRERWTLEVEGKIGTPRRKSIVDTSIVGLC